VRGQDGRDVGVEVRLGIDDRRGVGAEIGIDHARGIRAAVDSLDDRRVGHAGVVGQAHAQVAQAGEPVVAGAVGVARAALGAGGEPGVVAARRREQEGHQHESVHRQAPLSSV
jgi:hypothetical protein